jgi:DNA-binding CsgD family transcriptional regulator
MLRDDIVRLAHRGRNVRDFSLGAARIISRAVPFEGVCVLTMDPDTLLPVGEVVENGLPPQAFARMTEIEQGGEDYNAFRALAHGSTSVASLSTATAGDLDQSQRHREVRRPNGFGDELRAVLADDTTVWGALTLLRGADRPDFGPADRTAIASVSGVLAEGLRRAVVLTDGPPPEAATPAGVAVLAPDDAIVMADAAAERWLDELSATGPELPLAVTAVATQARGIVAGRADAGDFARARVRAPSGTWLLVRASTLGDEPDANVAVILEPARAHALAPLLADAYGLTRRERAVAQLVAYGLPTRAIARRLHISAWTVQDHLKAIFEKVGVSARGELIARMFFEHDAPRLTDTAH